ncbi:hypothetical protein CAPI_02540 [Corynebacterium capitovis DSM 44611]|uniref:S1 family peptidase n=1 Tax=Corynebacterium capitovis TaxID=131081 RepID=UPI00036FA678|nr:S1 family peptidase [Corynebacterium capitovis]WKD57081.1 hypothetical protein CAPI_02540 [Corynebacterium capitovis DSM 44611]
MLRRTRATLLALTTAAALLAGAPAHAHDASDPNYVWQSDLSSKVLAGKPFVDHVLHRVPGSFHDAPAAPAESAAAQARGHSLFGPGTPIYGGNNICTVAVAGYDAAGRMLAITAGHCGAPGTAVVSADSPQIGQSGTVVASGAGLDYAVIELGPNAEVTRSYNGLTINELGAQPQSAGTVVCKTGVASGTTCGITLYDWGLDNVSHVCAMPGDSGAPLTSGDRLVGIIAGSALPADVNVACYTPLQGAAHGPTRAIRFDAVTASLNAAGGVGSGFRLP